MIYLLRHGLTQDDGEKRFIGQLDLPLVETGRQQARQWREIFKPVELEAIYCSDLQRSVETAKIIARERHLSLRIVPELREINLGDWEGMAMGSVRRNFPDEWHNRGLDLASYSPPGGESFNDLKNRVIPAYEKLVSEAQGHILVVAHAGVNRMILCHLLGMPVPNLFRLKQDYGGLNIIDQWNNSPRVSAINMLPGGLVIGKGKSCLKHS